MARRVEFTKAGSPSTIRVADMPMPEPKLGQVRVKVAFAGINFADLLMRLGFYQPRPPYPFTPGYEVSGVIDSIGDEESEFTVGQRVVAAMSTGGQASHVVVDARRVLPLPDEITLEDAAAIPVTYLTAHHMLHHLGHLGQDESVLIHGGAGGVGTAALQLCQWAGVSQVWATASGSKSEIIESYGGRAIDRHNQDFVSIIKKETDGQGVDHILDPIGGDNLARSLSVLKEGGRLYTYGMSAVAPTSKRSMLRSFLAWRKTPAFDPLRLMTRNRGVFGVHMGTWKNEVVMLEQLQRVMEGVLSGALKPVIDTVFDVEDVAKAHQYLHDGKNIGKVLLRFK
ncbi:zinc-binding dehydrogenase [Euryarchaeota archaeon]|nr:zinc-binding dehydrogenase [Candidatus Poseidoniaceae archaeon]MDA8594390.1 zinc-binding dehydrogenase [Euryarchaeota archaeon]MDA8609585.1 zinc-binding dehydrogenase [Euryarchaeota archaeon]MDA8689472.1 zinc-binding dehydrogenase [Euryarchaeota archaeon]MDA9183069.1 zinc-binding dehydrogenase [Candidatus Poseidoniaceae archaeon]